MILTRKKVLSLIIYLDINQKHDLTTIIILFCIDCIIFLLLFFFIEVYLKKIFLVILFFALYIMDGINIKN